jgi:hypothetical protein
LVQHPTWLEGGQDAVMLEESFHMRGIPTINDTSSKSKRLVKKTKKNFDSRAFFFEQD